MREPEEYAEGHIPGAENVPLDQLTTIPPDRSGPLVVVCGSGRRSRIAAEQLTGLGIRPVASLAGGTTGWREAGRPVTSLPAG